MSCWLGDKIIEDVGWLSFGGEKTTKQGTRVGSYSAMNE